MSASMAEVLAKHQWMAASPDPAERCTCGIYPAAQTNKAMAAHQAEVLAANGYGNLEDAKAAALREAALELVNVTEHDSRMPGIRFAVGFLAGARRPE